MENEAENILDAIPGDGNKSSFEKFKMSHWNTPFAYAGIPFAIAGTLMAIYDLAAPSKMSPMGALIGLAIVVASLIAIGISYLFYRFFPKHKKIIWFVQLPFFLFLIKKGWDINLFGGILNGILGMLR